MRYAFKTATQHVAWTDLVDFWRLADTLEIFESGWIFDHFYPIDGDSSGSCLEAWTVLAALTQATRRLRLGVLVTGIPYRHPAVLANMAATVDVLSGGRLELGLGAGWNLEEARAYGIELGEARERSERLAEACALITMLMTQETSNFEGSHYVLTDARCEPKPIQKPVPLCIGGSGEKRTLLTAARFAHHWNFGKGTADEFARKVDILRKHCLAVGRKPEEITVSAHVRVNGRDGIHEAIQAALSLEGRGLDLAIFYIPNPLDAVTIKMLGEMLERIG